MVALDSNTVAMLRRWRAQQNEERLLVGPGYVDQGYVFCKPDGAAAYNPDRFSREFLRKQEQYNRLHAGDPLPRLTLHGLRHTWATLALHEGIDIKVVSDPLNHSSTFVTREIYTHVTPPRQSDAAERVAARVFRSQANDGSIWVSDSASWEHASEEQIEVVEGANNLVVGVGI